MARPPFGIDSAKVGAREYPVREVREIEKPF
jgi:hypothetical protein